MKKALIVLSSGILFLASCKEKPPVINFTPDGKDSTRAKSDTTYEGPVPANTDPHNVLIEEFTGQTCSNCPAAHEMVKGFVKQNPGRVNVIGLYNFNIQQTIPAAGAKYDFRHSEATEIGTKVYGGVGAIPSGGVDRVPVAGLVLVNTGNWAGALNTRLAVQDSLNLKLESKWDSVNNEAEIVALITYTKSMSGPHNLSIVLVEDSMIDKQEFPLGKEEEHYVFTNVFRGMVTAQPFGDPILPTMTVKAPGRVVQKVYYYKLPTKNPAINPAHCRLIAFVNATGGSKEVYQSTEVRLK